jgi:hypothetical protein
MSGPGSVPCEFGRVDVGAVDEGGVALEDGEPPPVADAQRGRGHPARVADDDLGFGVGAAQARVHRAGRGHARTAGGSQPRAALEGPDEDLALRQREQDRQVGPGGESLRAGRHLLPHRDQVGFDVLVDQRDQVRVRDGHRGERQGRVELGQSDLDRGAQAGHHRLGRGEVDGRVLEPHLPHAARRGRAASDRVLARTAADRDGLLAALLEQDPAQAAHPVAAELGGRAVGIEEPGPRDRRARVVEVDAVAAERAPPIAQVTDEGAQVGIGGEVIRR